MPALPHNWWISRGGVWATGDRDKEIAPGAAAELGAVPRVRRGAGRRVPYGTPPKSQHSGAGGGQGRPPPPGGGPDLLGLIPINDDDNLIPSGGVSRGSNKLEQPPG